MSGCHSSGELARLEVEPESYAAFCKQIETDTGGQDVGKRIGGSKRDKKAVGEGRFHCTVGGNVDEPLPAGEDRRNDERLKTPY